MSKKTGFGKIPELYELEVVGTVSATSIISPSISSSTYQGLTSASITNFKEDVQDAIAELLSAGPNIQLTYDDFNNKLQISGSAGSGISGAITHNGLSAIQGGTTGEYLHLTSAQWGALTSGGDASSYHIHDNRYYTETELTNFSTTLNLSNVYANSISAINISGSNLFITNEYVTNEYITNEYATTLISATNVSATNASATSVTATNIITTNLSATNHISTGNYIDFNPQSSVSINEGRLYYDSTDHTLCLYNDSTNNVLKLGYESLTRVVNKTGSIIYNGTVVYLNGVQGNRPTVTSAIAISANNSHDDVIGFATQDIAVNQEGFICSMGIVENLNTSIYPAGTKIYLSPTVSGGYTSAIPSGTSVVVELGFIIVSHQNQGKILVRIHPGTHLAYLHDVSAGTPTAGYYLKGGGSYWFGSNFDTDVTTNPTVSSVYTTVNTNSANWNNAATSAGIAFTYINSNSAQFNSTFATVNTNSANWNNAASSAAQSYSYINANSASSTNLFTSVQSNSGTWNGTYTSVNTNSANWNSAYNYVNTNSPALNSLYTNVNTNSANWQNAAVSASQSYSYINANSATIASLYTSVNTNSANWQSVYTNVNTNSANWQNTYTQTQLTNASTSLSLNNLSANTISANSQIINTLNVYGVNDAAITTQNTWTGSKINSSLSSKLSITDIRTTVILDDLSDVGISAPTNGQALIYSSATSSWINGTAGTGATGTVAAGGAGTLQTCFLSNASTIVDFGTSATQTPVYAYFSPTNDVKTIDTIRFYVQSQSGSVSISVGMFQLSGSSLIRINSGTVSVTSTGFYDVTMSSSINLTAGVKYYIGMIRQTTSGSCYIVAEDCIASTDLAFKGVGVTIPFSLPATETVFTANNYNPWLMMYSSTGGDFNSWTTTTKTTNYTATRNNVILCNTAAGNITITLPSASANKDKEIVVKKISSDAGIVTISASTTIDSDSTPKQIKFQNTAARFISDGSVWYII